MVGQPETLLGTCDDAELASLADIMSDHNSSTDHNSTLRFFVGQPRISARLAFVYNRFKYSAREYRINTTDYRLRKEGWL
jgi:hypothetical protein